MPHFPQSDNFNFLKDVFLFLTLSFTSPLEHSSFFLFYKPDILFALSFLLVSLLVSLPAGDNRHFPLSAAQLLFNKLLNLAEFSPFYGISSELLPPVTAADDGKCEHIIPISSHFFHRKVLTCQTPSQNCGGKQQPWGTTAGAGSTMDEADRHNRRLQHKPEVSSLSAAPEDSGLGVVKVFCPHLWVTTALPLSFWGKILPWNPFPLPVQSFFKPHLLSSAKGHLDFRKEHGKHRELLLEEPSNELELLSLVQWEALTGMLSHSLFHRINSSKITAISIQLHNPYQP